MLKNLFVKFGSDKEYLAIPRTFSNSVCTVQQGSDLDVFSGNGKCQVRNGDKTKSKTHLQKAFFFL
jgi:hypothetical protein